LAKIVLRRKKFASWRQEGSENWQRFLQNEKRKQKMYNLFAETLL
jgi:hypothetical protein